MFGGALERRAALLLAAALATGACRQIAGLQDLPTPCADPQMIDDMEDGDALICATSKRQGAWFGFGDGSSGMNSLDANAAIADGARGSSHRAVHFSGSGYTSWGAITGFNLNTDGVGRKTYDTTGTGGVTFWMKSDRPVEVQFPISETAVIGEGGTCKEGSPNCNAHFQFVITSPAAGWTQYRVPFTALRQLGSATWNPGQLLGVQFHVTNGDSFDLWIDDVAFYFCAGPECTPTCTDGDLSLACAKSSRHPAGCYPGWATCEIVDTWCADPMLVDDMEDGDDFACPTTTREGHWFTFTEDPKSAAFQFREDEIPGGRETSHRAAHLTASGLTGWGAGMGIRVNAPAGDSLDASAAGGVHFWMRGTGQVLVQLRIPETTPITSPPGTCTGGINCEDSFFFPIASSGDEWVEYRVPYAALRQVGTATWDPSHLLAIEFSVVETTFDIWVDDVSFYNCTGAACVPTCHEPEAPVACAVTSEFPAGCWPAGTDCAKPTDIINNTAIWGSGRDDLWISGFSAMNRKGTTLHWDGAGWTPVATNAPLAIWGVWGSGPGDVWTSGLAGQIYRWAGSSWMPVTSGTTASLFQGVWGSGPNDVWAAGEAGAMIHWNGSAWSPVAALTDQDLWGIWGAGADDVWAVGFGGTILHRTASGWSAVASGTTRDLDGVWGSAANDVWAVGDAVLHWNGSAWTSVPSGTTQYLDGVWGSSASDVWAVGNGGTILHWNGSAWAAAASGTDVWLSAVWGSAPDDVWAVGDENTILHFDGSAWKPMAVSR